MPAALSREHIASAGRLGSGPALGPQVQGAAVLRRRELLAAAGLLPLAAHAGTVLKVGPRRAVRSLAAAARQARDGMLIEIDAGDYVGDAAVWTQSDLTLRAVGGRVSLVAAGAHAQGKGLFVTTGRRMRIEGLDFSGATVPDRNGAGIRLEAGSLTLLDCGFRDNENGLLTANQDDIELDIVDCDFGTILPREGKTHNLYVGAIKRLAVTGSYFHHGLHGHLLKSRAALNHILYNRLSDEIGGRASYELEFPNGGVAVVMGNLIVQSSTTENPHVISFGVEGATWARQALYLVNNTLVDQLPSGGIWLRVTPPQAEVVLANNLLVGGPKLAAEGYWTRRANFSADWSEFVQAARDDYRLKPDSALRGRAQEAGEGGGLKLAPTREYRHPHGTVALSGPARNPGAFQG
ncbi:hypothetical protein [Roseateles saccharophilus]|uniref:Parallel beta helix pectate lyase-like protein n=1 Tax=Roseateles saccharophilus TaxID=304 RepID=A0A4R3V3W0_ROSSA|nr:hypothetical protein [Roseateles saccharophilus]MDG0832310.1 hypothetical protein [Roseateles saccharophilus]TCU97004.1 hypothetical protein EV671_101215 [Roseateles saccharophilus]